MKNLSFDFWKIKNRKQKSVVKNPWKRESESLGYSFFFPHSFASSYSYLIDKFLRYFRPSEQGFSWYFKNLSLLKDWNSLSNPEFIISLLLSKLNLRWVLTLNRFSNWFWLDGAQSEIKFLFQPIREQFIIIALKTLLMDPSMLHTSVEGDPIFSTWKNHTIFSTSIFDHFLHLDWTFFEKYQNLHYGTFVRKYHFLHPFSRKIPNSPHVSIPDDKYSVPKKKYYLNSNNDRYRFWPQRGWIYYRFVVSLNVTVTIKDRDSPVPRLNIPLFTFRALLYRLMAFQHYSPGLQLDSKN